MKKKVLIIKLGYSETLDPEIGRVPSLGDVLRTTPILWALKEKYPDSHITWLVSEPAEPLLNGNKFIDRILTWDHFVPFQLMKEKFDILINLEKIPGVCALTDMIDAWVKYGFRFETVSGSYHAYEKGLDFMSYIEDKRSDKSKGYWQQILIEMLGIHHRLQAKDQRSLRYRLQPRSRLQMAGQSHAHRILGGSRKAVTGCGAHGFLATGEE